MFQEVDVQWISKAQPVPSSIRQKLCSMHGSKQASLLFRRGLSKKRHETPKCSDGDEKLRDPHVPSCDPAPLRDVCFLCWLTASSAVGFCSIAGGCLRCLQGGQGQRGEAGAVGSSCSTPTFLHPSWCLHLSPLYASSISPPPESQLCFST